jgi:hypothetical protein
MVVSPFSVELSLAPGESKTKVLSMVNKGAQAFKVTVTAVPYSIRTDEYISQYSVLPDKVDASTWVTFANIPADLVVEPEKVQEITYTVHIPNTAKAGGYYIAVLVTTTPYPTPIGVVAHNRVAVTNYITVTGDLAQSGAASLTKFGGYVGGDVLTMPYTVKNTGQGHFIAKVAARVTTLWGHEVAHLSEEEYVLPATERRMTLEWPTKNIFGVYKVEQSAEYLGQTDYLSSHFIFVGNPGLIFGGILLVIGVGLLIGFRIQYTHKLLSKR